MPPKRTLDAFLPEQLRSQAEQARRGRLIVGLSFGFVGLLLVGLPLRLILAEPPGWLTIQLFNFGLFLAAPFVLRATGRLDLAGLLTLTAALISLLVVSYYEGGLHSSIVIMAPILPLVAMLMLGRGFGWGMTAIVMTLSAGSLVLHRIGFLHPRALLEEQQALGAGKEKG